VPIEPAPSRWSFPDPGDWDPDSDLVGVGADLEGGTLLAAYRRGIFPMPIGEPAGRMHWFSPVDRGVLPLAGLRVSRSLRRAARDLEIRVDTAFEEVIVACADPSRDSGWIDSDVQQAYTALHRDGWAHSVEAWRGEHLVGGLYGVAVGGLFAGESMFHRERDASKVALVGLVDLLRDEHAGRRLLDTQWRTPHLASLGVVEIPRTEYLTRLAVALAAPLPAVFDRP